MKAHKSLIYSFSMSIHQFFTFHIMRAYVFYANLFRCFNLPKRILSFTYIEYLSLVLQPTQTYSYYKEILRNTELPCAFVDLDRFDENIAAISRRSKDKFIRIASKSIRCVPLMQRILKSGEKFRGIMAYSAREAAWLAARGFDDILVGYPNFQQADIEAIIEPLQQGKQITLMLDLSEHAAQINAIGEKYQCVIPVCMDADMSVRFPGLYFGVYRSAVRNIAQAISLFRFVSEKKYLHLQGFMGYEAPIAGLNDEIPGKFFMNTFIKLLKNYSVKKIALRRKEIVEALKAEGANFDFVNGGGTGSLEWTAEEAVISEVTVGSGFFSPALFDHFSNFKHNPAAGFALEITRKPQHGIYTCAGGGYIASGATGKDKLPLPFLPLEMKLLDNEGAGEVQTPFRYSGKEPLEIGVPVFFRHAKAGELCERFNELLLISNGKIIDKVKTYRGEGQFFV